jgi:hypothetical protein
LGAPLFTQQVIFAIWVEVNLWPGGMLLLIAPTIEDAFALMFEYELRFGLRLPLWHPLVAQYDLMIGLMSVAKLGPAEATVSLPEAVQEVASTTPME